LLCFCEIATCYCEVMLVWQYACYEYGEMLLQLLWPIVCYELGNRRVMISVMK